MNGRSKTVYLVGDGEHDGCGDGVLTLVPASAPAQLGTGAISDGALSMILAATIRLEDKMTRFEDKMKSMRADVMLRLDRHENHLGDIRDDIAVSMGRADQAALVAVNTREEARLLSQQVALLQRQVNKLQTRLDQLEPK